jgi:hypothetical protein
VASAWKGELDDTEPAEESAPAGEEPEA